MDIRIEPRKLSGKIAAIPSKSAAHRALICAALADRETEIALSATSADIDATKRCLVALGAHIAESKSGVKVTPISVRSKRTNLDCGESGSTLRFLMPVAAAVCERTHFTGSGKLPQRPISDLLTALEAHGAQFSSRALPLEMTAIARGGRFDISGDVSSQFASGILLAAPKISGGMQLHFTTPIQSAGYLKMTIEMMKKFRISVAKTETGYTIGENERYVSPRRLTVEGDWSNAAFWLAAGALCGGVTMTGLSSDTAQGDVAILRLLERMGASVHMNEGEVIVTAARLLGADMNAADVPDLVPIFAAIAAVSDGETRIYNAARLRIKESDRLASVAGMINSLGGDAEETADGMIIRGKRTLAGGTVDGANDHRIVMSAAILASKCDSTVTILGAEAADKSYPAFWADYERLGGKFDVL